MSEPNACCQEWREECNKHLSRISNLEAQVAALTNRVKNAENETSIYKEENTTLREQLATAIRSMK